MSRKEVHRPGLVKAALAGRITNRQGEAALGVMARHFNRLKRRFQTVSTTTAANARRRGVTFSRSSRG